MPTLLSLFSQRRRGLGALAMVTVLAVSTSGAYADGIAGPAGGSVGAVGVGDPYFPLDGNGGLDVVHYDIHDRYDFDRRRLSGRTRLTIRATETLSRFNLDLLLPVKQVLVDGVAAAYTKPTKHELQITPRTVLPAGSTFTVDVRYRGKPGAVSYLEERNWLADAHEVVTMNEPHMAPWWFPANDHPLDKASFDVHITVPSDRKVVGNGRLVSRKVRGRAATTHWRATEPMAPYLAFFAAGKFETDHGRHDGRPWYVAVSKQLPAGQRSGLMRLMKKSSRITAWLERQLGDYPFSTTGGLVTGLRVDFALENQTRPIYPAISPDNVLLVVHELAHQWFGNSVSVERWRDIWINEGFATFLEWRYDETHGGRSGEEWLRAGLRSFAAGSGFWKVNIGDPGPARLFDGAVYDRGAMTLQALRNVVGEQDFWAILGSWAAARRHGTGSVADFRAHSETVSGVDLDAFFTAWLDTPARPADTAANGLG